MIGLVVLLFDFFNFEVSTYAPPTFLSNCSKEDSADFDDDATPASTRPSSAIPPNVSGEDKREKLEIDMKRNEGHDNTNGDVSIASAISPAAKAPAPANLTVVMKSGAWDYLGMHLYFYTGWCFFSPR